MKFRNQTYKKNMYFSNKFSKIAKRWGLSASYALFPSILVIWRCVIWQNCVFQTNYDEIEF